MHLVQFQCPRLREWPRHSCEWGSRPRSGSLHPKGSVQVCITSASPHLLSSIPSPHYLPRFPNKLPTSLLLCNPPFSLQPAPSIKKLVYSYHTQSYLWETLGPTALRIKSKLLTLAHKGLPCSLALSPPQPNGARCAPWIPLQPYQLPVPAACRVPCSSPLSSPTTPQRCPPYWALTAHWYRLHSTYHGWHFNHALPQGGRGWGESTQLLRPLMLSSTLSTWTQNFTLNEY